MPIYVIIPESSTTSRTRAFNMNESRSFFPREQLLDPESQLSFIPELQQPPNTEPTPQNFFHWNITEWLSFISDVLLIVRNSIMNFAQQNGNNDNSVGNDNLSDAQQHRAELLQMIQSNSKYIPYILIPLIIFFIDHILEMIVLILFLYFNIIVKLVVAKSSQQTNTFLLLSSFMVLLSFLMFCYFFTDTYQRIIEIYNPYDQLKSLNDLVWTLLMIDYILKLTTIIIKIIFLMMPTQYFPTFKRGTVLVFIEATSQLYCYFMPIYPWANFFLKSYQNWYFIGYIYCFIYLVMKGSEFMDCFELWLEASKHLFYDAFDSPSIEKLMAAGNGCPICLKPWTYPIILKCKHIICNDCLLKILIVHMKKSCPMCNTTLIYDETWRNGATSKFIHIF